MKNREKYENEIANSKARFCADFIQPIFLKQIGEKCTHISCHWCACMLHSWLEEEYIEPKEPEIDWSAVEVDAPVLVKQYEDDPWRKRYFAKYANNMVYTYANGASSWSDSGDENTIDWQYAKLAEEEAK